MRTEFIVVPSPALYFVSGELGPKLCSRRYEIKKTPDLGFKAYDLVFFLI